MLKFPKEKVIDRFDALPEHIQQLLTSNELVDTIWTIGEAHHLGEERTSKVTSIIGAIILGFLHVEDLAKEIIKEAQIDKRLAEEIAHEIQLKLLNPIMPEINAAFSYNIRGAPPTAPISTVEPTQPTIIKPTFTPPKEVESSKEPTFAPPSPELRRASKATEGKQVVSGQPFILHEEQKEIEQARPKDEALVRPSFYEGPDMRHETSDINAERPAAARLEIGGAEEGRKEGPQVSRTEEPPIRVVHYSGPQTPVDPFGSQTSDISNQPLEAKEQKPEPPKDIHPENIVDLKDLPK